ncbi:MAG: ATP phosphoribosyltransferase [Dehalococcoidales bacterium]|nr:ATP phosphoribosyltransferase [Dehalococcoidales bacterium]MDP6825053.1 ATP phosphoribosyltransferase [Dehalococcoidales bacterium]
MPVKIALPKGRLLDRTAVLLRLAEWGLDGYHEEARFYHIRSQKFPTLTAKVFHEKDIPIQVAVGNYDLGICGLDWVEELLAKYPSSTLVKIKGLGYDLGSLYVVAGRAEEIPAVAEVKARKDVIRIASEYPNLAESFALKNRLGRFSVFPVWGGAEVYPPENAELALIRGQTETEFASLNLVSVSKMLDFGAFLIANRYSWESKSLAKMVASICDSCHKFSPDKESPASGAVAGPKITLQSPGTTDGDIRFVLPDGHQQKPVRQLLDRAGIKIDDYPSETGNRRPVIGLDGVVVKVIRPQDMPWQVANGNCDLAVTGEDWLREHLYQFPSSPVKELLKLRFGKVRIVAVVSQELSAAGISGLRQLGAERLEPVRVASEYVNIADKFARENHLGHYRVVPTWGATEAFLPEDADLLIENTQTGKTIADHNLKIIDTLFESTGCLIGGKSIDFSTGKGKKIAEIMTTLRGAVEGT